MNELTQRVDRAIHEMKEWNESDPEAGKYQGFMIGFLQRVEVLKEKNEMKEFSQSAENTQINLNS